MPLIHWLAVLGLAVDFDSDAIMRAEQSDTIGRLGNESDAALLRRVAAREMEALAELCRRYESVLLAHGRGQLRMTAQDVEEVAQDTFKTIWFANQSKTAAFNGNPNAPVIDSTLASAWIWAIFVRGCQARICRDNAVKRGSGQVFAMADVLKDEVRADGDEDSVLVLKSPELATKCSELSPSTQIMSQERSDALRQAVRQAVRKLPTKYRRVLLLKYYKRLEYAEIAQLLKMPVGTVGTWLHKATAALRKALERKRIYELGIL